MSKPLPLPVWDRWAGKLIEEMSDDHPATYESEPQRSLSQWLKSHPLFDWLVAAYENTRWSGREIEPFIRKHHIDMSEFEQREYRSFADFFDRRFVPGARKFPSSPGEMGAFAEARYFAWERLEGGETFPVKGHSLNAEQILGQASNAWSFVGGPVLLVRLAPVDYHHVHYPDDGRTLSQHRLGGRLWTVNWHALQNKPDILFENERMVSILETRNFGRLAFVEVGWSAEDRQHQAATPQDGRAFAVARRVRGRKTGAGSAPRAPGHAVARDHARLPSRDGRFVARARWA